MIDTHIKQILTGNILIIVCCAFYILWWLLAFKPTGAITGMKTDWLLIPAVVAAAVGIFIALGGIRQVTPEPGNQLFPGGAILIGGVAVLVVLLVVTLLVFKRPVTTELFLIVGWGILALSELNALFAAGVFSHNLSIAFVIIVFAVVAVSMVCYVLYYRLDGVAGYIDGMIPLLLAALTTAALSCFIVFAGK